MLELRIRNTPKYGKKNLGKGIELYDFMVI